MENNIPPGTVPLMHFKPVLPPIASLSRSVHRAENTHEENHECGLYRCVRVGFRVIGDPEKFKY